MHSSTLSQSSEKMVTGRTIIARIPGKQENQDSTAWAGQPGRKARTRKLGQGSQERTVNKGQPENDGLSRTAKGKGRLGQVRGRRGGGRKSMSSRSIAGLAGLLSTPIESGRGAVGWSS